MKFLLYTCILFFFSSSLSAQFIFDFQSSSLSEKILDNEFYIKEHLLGNDVAKKVKMLDLYYKWIDPPTATRLNSMIRIEKQPIFFGISKIISARYYKSKINKNKLTTEEAKKQICEILDIAIMIRYQDTKEFENHIRSLNGLNGDIIVEVFTKNIKLSDF